MATISATGSKNHHTFTLNVVESSYSVADNTSSISFNFVLSPVRTGYDWANWGNKISYSITINGTSYNGSIPNYDGSSTVTLKSGTQTVTHNSDGKKTISLSFSVTDSAGKTYTPGNASASGTMALTNIPRKATITSASNFTDSSSPSFNFSNPGGFTLDAKLIVNPTAVSPTVLTRTSIANSSPYTWTLTSAEIDTLRNACSGANCTVRYSLVTHIGSGTDTHNVDKTFTIVASEATRPNVSLAISPDNSNIPLLVRDTFAGLYIQTKTKISGVITASGNYGSTITGYSTVIDGNNYTTANFTSSELVGYGEYTIASTAIDSRGFTNSDSETISVLAYNKPVFSPIASKRTVDCYRSDSNGNPDANGTTVWLNAKKVFYSLNNLNNCNLMYRRKLEHESWNNQSWTTLTTVGDEYSGALPVTFEVTNVYNVQIKVEDTIGELSVLEFAIPTDDVPIHLGNGGKSLGLGRYADTTKPYSISIGWTAYFDEDIYIKRGNTYIRLLDLIYPVGIVYISVNNVSPAMFFGGTWEPFATGRTLVGVDTTQTEFDTVEKTGGSKEMQKHNHTGSTGVGYTDSMRVVGTPGLDINENHVVSYSAGSYTDISNTNNFPGGNHIHSFTTNETGTGNSGNLQPYITVYMWKRVID